MCVSANRLSAQAVAEEVPWTCPRGHGESDDAPLPSRLYCRGCDKEGRDPFYDPDEVALRDGAREVAHAGA